jgi:hypothetical protein
VSSLYCGSGVPRLLRPDDLGREDPRFPTPFSRGLAWRGRGPAMRIRSYNHQSCSRLETATVSHDLIFWEVDAQADFMLPGGKLYVPGAEKLLPNIRRLTNAAREDRVFGFRMTACMNRAILSSRRFRRIASSARLERDSFRKP